MARGPKKHMKRVHAPKHWMLDKLGGVYAPRPSCGPHKSRECIPMLVLIRNRLRYALTYDEVKMVLMQRHVKVDNKIRTDKTFPIGFQDVVTIDKTKESFRMMYDTRGRFVPVKIRPEEASYKLCRVKATAIGKKKTPYASTHDGRTIRFVHPDIKAMDVVRFDLETGKVLDFIKFGVGNLCMIVGGNNAGRVGHISCIDKHIGSPNIVHIKDASGHEFATRMSNVFTIGTDKPWVSLPKEQGIRATDIEDRMARIKKAQQSQE